MEIARVTSISAWADGELRPFLEEYLASGRSDLAEMRGLVERYGYLADERARCWRACERVLGAVVPALGDDVDGDEDVDELGQSHGPAEEDTLHRFRGRKHFMVHHEGVSLVIRWEIVSDSCAEAGLRRKVWTSLSFGDGEDVESSPETKEAEDTFQALVEGGKDYAEVIRILVGAVFGDVVLGGE